MKRVLFIMIIITVILYDAYQIKYYFENKESLEKELKTKSEKISEVIKYFIKENIERSYVLEDLFYKKTFLEFEKNCNNLEEYNIIDKNYNTVRSNFSLDINSVRSKLKEILEQKIKAIEVYNNGIFIVIAGYKNGEIHAAKFYIPQEMKGNISLDDFKKSVMEKGDIKEILISKEKKEIKTTNSERVISKEIIIYDSLNEEEKKYLISIKFNMENYLRMTNKNLMDVVFSLVITILIMLLVVLYVFLNNKYYKAKEYFKEKEKDILVGSVASGVAHEIRNPLNAINYTIEYMKATTKEDDVKNNLTIIKEEIRRIEKSLKEFLDIRKEIAFNKEMLSINEIVKELLALLKNEYEAHEIKFEITEKKELKIDGDRDKIKEVFLNILKNSRESFGSDKKGEIFICIDKNEISFVDNGKGMDQEEVEKIFNLYYTTKEDGNGIGMYRAKKIIEGHNGVIAVKSYKGKGTEMTIKFNEVI